MINFSKFKAMYGAYKTLGLTDWVKFNFLGIKPIPSNYNIVDLGSVDWTYDGINSRFGIRDYTVLSGMKTVATSASIPNFYCYLYKAISINEFDYQHTDMAIRGHTSLSGYIFIRNLNYTDEEEFKLAMSGIYLIYEKA